MSEFIESEMLPIHRANLLPKVANVCLAEGFSDLVDTSLLNWSHLGVTEEEGILPQEEGVLPLRAGGGKSAIAISTIIYEEKFSTVAHT